MSALAATLLLVAAAIHAGWNALIKSEADRLQSIAILAVFSALPALPLMLVFPPPAPESWPFLGLSAAIQVGYCFALVRAYDHGDLASVYPIARGSAPVLVTLGAALTAGELPDASGLAGIALISGGILALTRNEAAPSKTAIRAALMTGLFIASYTVVDGLGVRVSESAIGYAVWQAAAAGTLIALSFVAIRRRAPTMPAGRAGAVLALAGALSALAYGISVWAISVAAMGEVSAIRETSIVLAALIGAVVLKEKIAPRKWIAVIAVAIGVVLLSAG
ncbi:EamA family transporter [Erythrobacter sp.]|jgi:drug/metabolite transporter (DMT)-like permease|uniref:EamA family transporter n=1 Tax=Erythrobacter sp. TaxID=1042 RepID=UPI002EA053BD|nr:EamA family transporter [Erythrobacter sp.]